MVLPVGLPGYLTQAPAPHSKPRGPLSARGFLLCTVQRTRQPPATPPPKPGKPHLPAIRGRSCGLIRLDKRQRGERWRGKGERTQGKEGRKLRKALKGGKVKRRGKGQRGERLREELGGEGVALVSPTLTSQLVILTKLVKIESPLSPPSPYVVPPSLWPCQEPSPAPTLSPDENHRFPPQCYRPGWRFPSRFSCQASQRHPSARPANVPRHPSLGQSPHAVCRAYVQRSGWRVLLGHLLR